MQKVGKLLVYSPRQAEVESSWSQPWACLSPTLSCSPPHSISGVLLDLEAGLHTRRVPSGPWMLTHYGRMRMLGYSEPWDSHFEPCKL